MVEVKPDQRIEPEVTSDYTKYKLIRARITKDLGVQAIYKRIR